MACLIERFFERAAVPARCRGDAHFMERLHAQVEAAKRALSDAPKAVVRVLDGEQEYRMDLDDAGLETWCAALLARLRDPIERVLRDTGLALADLDNIVLAGGATRMPVVRRTVTRMFWRFPACDLNPDEVVALGAAVQAGLKSRDAALEEVVMTDVAPYSMGIAVSRHLDCSTMSNGHYDPIIERNSVIPMSRVKRYVPSSNQQSALRIDIYQGEARMVADNIKLGQLTVALPSGSRDENSVDVRFTYDVNGLLQVEATLGRTGEVASLLIEGNPGVLAEDEIKARFAALSELKIHPRERIENRTLLARGERLYQLLRGRLREQMGDELLRFEQALETQDRRIAASAADVLLAVLDQVERQSHLLGRD